MLVSIGLKAKEIVLIFGGIWLWLSLGFKLDLGGFFSVGETFGIFWLDAVGFFISLILTLILINRRIRDFVIAIRIMMKFK
ncbi:MAG: hypothetical protein ABJB76_09590 [Candidatus Nitrosocosmicus sp.]